MTIPIETEGKWLVQDLRAVEFKLSVLGAQCIQPRTYEHNLRFDTPDRLLSSQHKVLRLREDSAARCTFKSPQRVENGIRRNQEIEFTVNDAEQARHFLEALGYQVYFVYEKYRAVYAYGGCHIMLDELPYGDFIEIEGEHPRQVLELAGQLGLNPAASSALNYASLFSFYCENSDAALQHLTFANFEGRAVLPDQLGLLYADR